MSEEYEIIFVPGEGRAVKDNKTKRIYYSEFQIIEEKNQEIEQLKSRLQQKENIIKEVREFAKLRKEMYERQENVVGQEVIISLLEILDKENIK